jgi:serine/threonine protein kinase
MIAAGPSLSERDASFHNTDTNPHSAGQNGNHTAPHELHPSEPNMINVPSTPNTQQDSAPSHPLPSSTTPEDAALIDFNEGSLTNKVEDHYTIALQREVAVMKRLRHKNIVPLYEAIDDPHEQALYLVMKYVEKGPIVHLDATWSCPPLDIDYVRCITRQTASGVAYLHKHHIAHRDIKPDNILLGADGVVYLSDFGVSQIFENDDRVTNSDGTPAYAAPEIVRGTEGYSAMKADIWALGVTVYTLTFGCAPFIAPSIFLLNEKIAQQPIDFSVRGEMSRDDDFDDVIDLLRKMLERDADKRISAVEVCQHKFIYRRQRISANGCPLSHQRHGTLIPHHRQRDSLNHVSSLTAAKFTGSESGGDSSEGLTSSTSVADVAGAVSGGGNQRSTSPATIPSISMNDLITEEEVMCAFTSCR